MANPDFLNFSTEQASTGAITVNAPGGWAANNILLLFVATDGNFTPTLSTANGYVIAQDPAGNTASVNIAGQCGMHIFWKRAVGNNTTTDPVPVLAAPSGGGTVQCCHQGVYSNCRTTGTPFHKISTSTLTSAATAIATPGITTALKDCTVFGCAASAEDDSLFQSWGFTATAASPGGSLDNGWHTSLGNRCSWAGGRGGYASVGGPRSGNSNFATSTQQARIGFALASLRELSLTAASGTIALTGTAAGTKVAYKMPATSGSFALTGSAAALSTGHRMTAVSGSFALSGSAASTKVARKISAASGTFALTGTAATLTVVHSGITAVSGSFALTGTTATLRQSHMMAAGAGSFALAGMVAALTTVHGTMVAGAGTFALTGSAATLKRSVPMPAATGAFALAGSPATLIDSGASLAVSAGAFALAGSAATLKQSHVLAAAPGAFALAGTAAQFSTSGLLAIGSHAVDAQPFPFSDRNALIVLATQATGSVVVLASGGKSSDVTQTWTDNKGNSIRKLTTVQDYPDFGGYGTQVGVTRNPMAGGSNHQFTIPVSNGDEDTSFAVEIKGGRRVRFLNTNVNNAGGGTTQAIGPIVVDDPRGAALIAFWWGSSPVNPPFSGTGGPHGSGTGTPFTAVPDSGFSVLDGYLFNWQNGEVQAAMASKVVTAAGNYSVTWTHSPAQGAQLWLVAIQAAALITADPATYAFIGTAATLKRKYVVAAASGSFALTGSATALTTGHKMPAASGAFAWTGQAEVLRAARNVAGGTGAFALTGSTATLRTAHRVAGDSGTFVLAGSTAGLLAIRRLPAASVAYALTGSDASLSVTGAVKIAASAGAYALAGSAVTFRRAYHGVAGAGAFAWTGQAVQLATGGGPQHIVLTVGSGAFTFAWNEINQALHSVVYGTLQRVGALFGAPQRTNALLGLLEQIGPTMIDLIGPLEIDRGDSISWRITVTDDADQPIDITGYVLELQVKQVLDGPDPAVIAAAIGTGITILTQSGATLGQADIAIASSATNIASGQYWLDVVKASPGDRTHVIRPRQFTVAGVVNGP